MVEVGIKGKQTKMVDETNTAEVYGSGDIAVFATPAMIGLMEYTAAQSVAPLLDNRLAGIAACHQNGNNQDDCNGTAAQNCGHRAGRSGLSGELCSLRRGSGRQLAAPVFQLFLSGFADIGDDQQGQNRHEQQGGDRVDLGSDTLLGHAVNGHGQRGRRGTGGEITDDKVVHTHGERSQSTGNNAGLDLGQNDLPESLHPGAAEVHGRIHQVLVHLTQLGADGQDHIGDVECDVGNQQGAETERQTGGKLKKILYTVDPGCELAPQTKERHKEQTHGDAGYDIGVHHGNVVNRGQEIAVTAAQGVEADGCECARKGSDQRDQQGGIDTPHDQTVMEQLLVPVQGEACPDGVTAAFVERKDDQQQNGSVQEQEYQSGKRSVERRVFPFHSITACSSPSPKRFMTTMHTTTMIIMTREMAAPRCGL